MNKINFNYLQTKFKFIILFLSSLFVYGGIVLTNNNHCPSKKSFCKITSPLSKPAKLFYKGLIDFNYLRKYKTLSGMVSDKNLGNLDESFSNIDQGFNFNYEKDTRKDSGFILLSKSNPKNRGMPQIELWDLNKQIALKKWNLEKSIKKVKEKIKSNSFYFLHPFVYPDGSLVFASQRGGGYLIKINQNGDVVKIKDDFSYHHSINIDSKGLIYVCVNNKNDGRQGFNILNKNFKIISTFYIEDIYAAQKLLPRLYSSNASDPIHINDVQPLLKKDGTKSDIVFISLRSPASIITYNLKEKKIVNIFDSFTSQQHDVDIINRSNNLKLSIFDNNVKKDNTNNLRRNSEGNKIIIFDNFKINQSNYIDIYSPNSKSFLKSNIKKSEINFKNIKGQPKPKTISSGLSEYNSVLNTFIIEESNYGRIFEFDYKSGQVEWTYLNSDQNKENYWRLSWSRFYQKNPLTE